MRVTWGPSMCAVSGDTYEIEAVRTSLCFNVNDEPIEFLTDEQCFLTGLFPALVSGLRNTGHTVEVEGYRDTTVPLGQIVVPPVDGVTLRDYQESLIRKAIFHGRGVIDAATGSGKTEIAVSIIKWYLDHGCKRVLYVVNNLRLQEQTAERLRLRGLRDVGCISGMSCDTSAEVTVGMVQSLYRMVRRDGDFREWMEGVDLLIFDEAHHLPANTWTLVASSTGAAYRFGLSATTLDPFESRVEDYILMGVVGPTIGKVSSYVLRQRGVLSDVEVRFIEHDTEFFHNDDWKTVYKRGVVECDARNDKIVEIAKAESERGRSVVVFVTQVRHGKMLASRFEEEGVTALFVKGAGEVFDSDDVETAHQRALDDITAWINQPGSVTIVTQVFDEGLDVSGVNTIIFGGGGKSYRRVVQRIGRGLRRIEGGDDSSNTCRVIDFSDRHNPFLRSQSKRRRQTYDRERIRVSGRP